jgi:hypothetical protein
MEGTRALTGNRILNMSISNYTALNVGDGVFPGDKMWQPIAPGAGVGIYSETYFDLSGYELDDLTLVPKLIQLQDGMPYMTGGAQKLTAIDVFDVVSQERLDPSDFQEYAISGDYPSSPGSTQDWTQILFCNTRFMVPSTEFNWADLLVPATKGSFGSSEPTAVQKLWLYRIITFRGVSDAGEPQTLYVPATRFVLGAEIIDEPELDYMMRLKRSYELSTQG